MDWQLLYDRLYAVYGDCVCPLVHDSPFQLLAAVMLSAQCRDERVNQVTEKLFALAPDAPAMAALDVAQIAEIIKPCGLHGTKSKNLQGAAQMILDRFNGVVPQTMEELTQLPGIGRKSANVLLGNVFHIPGFPVDTHVKRLLNRLGAVKSDDPEKSKGSSIELWLLKDGPIFPICSSFTDALSVMQEFLNVINVLYVMCVLLIRGKTSNGLVQR